MSRKRRRSNRGWDDHFEIIHWVDGYPFMIRCQPDMPGQPGGGAGPCLPTLLSPGGGGTVPCVPTFLPPGGVPGPCLPTPQPPCEPCMPNCVPNKEICVPCPPCPPTCQPAGTQGCNPITFCPPLGAICPPGYILPCFPSLNPPV